MKFSSVLCTISSTCMVDSGLFVDDVFFWLVVFIGTLIVVHDSPKPGTMVFIITYFFSQCCLRGDLFQIQFYLSWIYFWIKFIFIQLMFCNKDLFLLYWSHPWVPVTTAWHIPWVVDGGVGLQIWRLAVNIFNKQSWTADQEWSSSLRGWREANNLTL